MFQLLAQLASKTESILVLKDELAFTDRYLSHIHHISAFPSKFFSEKQIESLTQIDFTRKFVVTGN